MVRRVAAQMVPVLEQDAPIVDQEASQAPSLSLNSEEVRTTHPEREGSDETQAPLHASPASFRHHAQIFPRAADGRPFVVGACPVKAKHSSSMAHSHDHLDAVDERLEMMSLDHHEEQPVRRRAFRDHLDVVDEHPAKRGRSASMRLAHFHGHLYVMDGYLVAMGALLHVLAPLHALPIPFYQAQAFAL